MISGELIKSNNNLTKKRWLIFIAIVLLASIATLYVYNVIEIERMLRQIHKLEKRKAELEVELSILKTKINKLESAERIIPLAKEKLGMVETDTFPEKITIQNKEE